MLQEHWFKLTPHSCTTCFRDDSRRRLVSFRQFQPGLECSVEAYGKLLGVRGEERLMGVWKEMGWDGMDMDLAEKIYKRKVGPQRLACT